MKLKPKYTIKWTPKALDTFEAISLQLIERWNIETALSFDKIVQNTQSNSKQRLGLAFRNW